MTAVKTLALSVVAWAAIESRPAHADVISQAARSWPWTFLLSSNAANSYQASGASGGSLPDAGAHSVGTTRSLPALGLPASTSPLAASAPVTTPAQAVLAHPAAAATPPVQASSNIAAPSAAVDAFINMTAGSYPEANSLTTGGAQPWYTSPAVIQAFGGVEPNAQQQASFTQTVLHDVQHTYELSGMNPTLTTDPNFPALHTISVVANTSYPSNPSAIGITDVGSNGFSFIDKLNYASNSTDLAWAVAHNISHELMHAFGIGYHPDGGNYVDAGTATWSKLTDPNTQFGPAATQLLLASDYGRIGSGSGLGLGAELLNPAGTKIDGDEVLPQAIPEPDTMAIWALGALGGLVVLRRRTS
jgi:MYXO-CTERM domain-containing protein